MILVKLCQEIQFPTSLAIRPQLVCGIRFLESSEAKPRTVRLRLAVHCSLLFSSFHSLQCSSMPVLFDRRKGTAPEPIFFRS